MSVHDGHEDDDRSRGQGWGSQDLWVCTVCYDGTGLGTSPRGVRKTTGSPSPRRRSGESEEGVYWKDRRD